MPKQMKNVPVSFNLLNEFDKELYDEVCKHGNKSGAIKTLLRELFLLRKGMANNQLKSYHIIEETRQDPPKEENEIEDISGFAL